MDYATRLSLFTLKRINLHGYHARLFYAVHHSEKRGIFYVKLDETSRAVLQYKSNGKILDMQAVNVPSTYKGLGLGHLLAETAFTYAIVNYYYIYLTCEYLQKYYLTIKNPDLEERIIGPQHILEGPDAASLDKNIIYELPDPEDFLIYNS